MTRDGSSFLPEFRNCTRILSDRNSVIGSVIEKVNMGRVSVSAWHVFSREEYDAVLTSLDNLQEITKLIQNPLEESWTRSAVGTYDGYCICSRLGKRNGEGRTS